jgi:hypothetical protein
MHPGEPFGHDEFLQHLRPLVQVDLNCDSIPGIPAVIQLIPIVGVNDVHIIVVVTIVCPVFRLEEQWIPSRLGCAYHILLLVIAVTDHR